MAARARAAIAAAGPQEAFRIPPPARPARPPTSGGSWSSTASRSSRRERRRWIPLAQPYGRFVTEMLTPQRYPEVKLGPGRDIVRPYDVAAWSLPLMMGVEVEHGTLPDGLTPFAPAAAAPLPEGAAFALAPGSPENAKVVNAAAAGEEHGRDRACGRRRTARDWPAGTVFLDAGRGARRPRQLRARRDLDAGRRRARRRGQARRAPRRRSTSPGPPPSTRDGRAGCSSNTASSRRRLDNETIRARQPRDRFDAIVLPDESQRSHRHGSPKRRRAR